MSSDTPAISVRGLTKEYRLGQQKGRSALSEVLANPFRRNGSRKGEWFQALEDVSFDVAPGTALGIIGRNGAGKSTLLKLLSRITKPTAGEIILRGRVGSLLEVGTGFHPELTGRENVFMNGAILGMRKAEITRKFDEIVAFAEVERFIDTPVKRYSSGMYVRLAFAVAAHLEPEILLVDEVLAVGDAEFQKKCLGTMGEVAREGRTVLFVSHNTVAVQQLTTTCLLLRDGAVVMHDATASTLEHYLVVAGQAMEDVDLDVVPRPDTIYGRSARLLRVRLIGETAGGFPMDASPAFEVTYSVLAELPSIRLAYTVFRFDGTPIGTAWAAAQTAPVIERNHAQRFTMSGAALAPGSYYLALGLGRGDDRTGSVEYDLVMDTVHFQITPPRSPAGAASRWDPVWGNVRLADPLVETVGSR